MATYTTIRFDIGNNSYILKDTFIGVEINSIKYYLIQMSTSDITIFFRFNSHILSNTTIEIYQDPTLTSNGRLLSGITTINIYADPTVTTDGMFMHDIDADSEFIDVHIIDLLANKNYLLKIIPKDLNSTIVS